MEIPETSLLCLAGSDWWREQRETAQTSHTSLLWTTVAAACLSPRLSCSSSSPRFWLQLNINAIRTLLASGRVFWYIWFDYQISVGAGLATRSFIKTGGKINQINAIKLWTSDNCIGCICEASTGCTKNTKCINGVSWEIYILCLQRNIVGYCILGLLLWTFLNI